MHVALILLYLVCHALALALLPERSAALSFVFLVGAPVLAALACLWRARRGLAVLDWSAAASAVALWGAGMGLNMLQALGSGDADASPGSSMLLYILYGVPLTFVLARARRETWAVGAIDAALAALLGYLFFVHTFSYATRTDVDEQGLVYLRRMFDLQNLFIAGFAGVRWLASDDPDRRVFFRSLTAYALVYLLVAAYINHWSSESRFGAYSDLVIDVPFLLLAWLALRHPRPSAARPPAWLVRSVQAAAPMLLPLLLLLVSALVVAQERQLAVAGFVLATIGFGLRSTLLQINLLERQSALDLLARQDGLTGLANRREFDRVLQAACSRGLRDGGGLGLLLIDIDHFKAFNDSHGHPAGDGCLRVVANVLATHATRDSDVVARYGGEEFAVVLAAASQEQVRALAERLRQAVAGIPAGALAQPVTVSIGLSHTAADGQSSPDELLAKADAALYAAKRAGRNQVH